MSEQLFQVSVKAVIRNDKGEIILQGLRTKDNQIEWDLPGGRIDEGEDVVPALIRELREELAVEYDGVPSHIMTVKSTVMMPTESGEVALMLVIYDVTLAADAKPRAAETDSVIEWVSPGEAASRIAWKFPSSFSAFLTKL